MTLDKLQKTLLMINSGLSILVGCVGIGLILYAEAGLSSLGYSGLILILLPIPFLITSDGVALFLIKGSPATKYYSISRVLLLMLLTGLTFQSASELDASALQPLLVVINTLFAMFTTYILFRPNLKSWLFRIAIATFSTVVILNTYLALGAGGVIQTSVTEDSKDQQIAYDFQLLSQDIQYMYNNRGGFPSGTARDMAQKGEYSVRQGVADRADAYDYIISSDGETFELCATFATDTTDDPDFADGPGYYENNPYYHKAGYQCFTYETY